MGSDIDVVVSTRISHKNKDVLENIVTDDIKYTSVSHLLRIIIDDYISSQSGSPKQG